MIRLLVSLAVAFGLATAAAAQERVVNVYNWSDYIDPKALDEFTKETGIKVVYDTYDNNEIVETKLLAGKSGYDIVVPSGPFLQRLIGAKIFQKLDKAKLPNLANQWPDITQRLAVFDPGNQYAVNYMWGTTGIGVNLKKVREILGNEAPLNTWDLVMKPEIASKLKACGIYMLDSPEDLFPGILAYLGLNPDSKRNEDLTKAGDALFRVRSNVQKFHSSEYINALANGDICVAVGYSGDIIQAKLRAEEAKNGVEVAYVIPREGALMWFDNFAIPADAKNVAEAHAFIDFMLKPEIAAMNTNFVSYASGNLAAKKFVKPEILNDPGIYPDDATFKRLFTNTAYDERSQRTVTRLWTRVKTGR
ncbi:polyamine ABC transporter substrate-binding protein [Microvirga sp. 17 mud 1-3]|uniref:polyamine ABC transporter substrate-binding protein n=1 Tax=Microvirga sp. 17 mud 1-3 TaxID=2082949 RepID=UPI000D6BF3F3|nr:polyamine ABC transporter substrate-binding protein [Microvirga sp. 17 mud 1-3]AWM88896.1 spermidine/putrescine ABC transporter substrate-binding protein PotF [Microvirga sp. 17 mud 1-3]